MDPNTLITYSKKKITWGEGGTRYIYKAIEGINADYAHYRYYPAIIKSSDSGIQIKGVSGEHNAYYIANLPRRTCIAKSDANTRILVSSQFSGCVYQLWQDTDGEIIGAHVYKGKESNQNLGHADIKEIANKKKWKFIDEIKTGGLIKNEKDANEEVFVVSLLSPTFQKKKLAETVVLVVGGAKCKKWVKTSTKTFE